MLHLTRLGLPFTIAFGAVVLTCLAYGASMVRRRKALDVLASGLFVLSLAALSWILIERYIEAGRPPFKTMYESLVLFAACVALVYTVVERFYRLALLGLLASIFVVAIMGYAALKTDVDVIALPAALQSGWFVPHVVVYFLGYAALFMSSALAVIFLFRPEGTVKFANLKAERVVRYHDLMHTVTKFGFALITIGLVIGALWAKGAWGDYWVWDPKENWSLITWLIYIMYFHVRTSRRWQEKHSAWVLMAGFAAVIFTYLGMNALPTAEQSAHVYQ
jgi:cytochrome c-type biogenesis protein CcsB